MSNQLPPPGDYFGKPYSKLIIPENESGAVNVIIPCKISRGDHVGHKPRAQVCLIKKDGSPMAAGINNMKRILGWDGVSFEFLVETDFSEVEFALNDCRHTTWDGETRLEVGFVNAIDDAGGLAMIKPANLKSLTAKFGSKLRALASADGPAKKSAPPTAKKTNPPAPSAKTTPAYSGPPSTQDKAWGECQKAYPNLNSDEQGKEWFAQIKKLWPDCDIGEIQNQLTPLQWGQLANSFDYVPH